MSKDPFDEALGGEYGEREAGLAEAFYEYARRIEAGEKLDREEIRRLHPELAEELIRDLEGFATFGAELCPAEIHVTLGDYTLRRQVGRGGMGVVYEAWQNSLERRVALKVLPAGIAADTKVCSRFLREAQVSAKLSHPSVVPVHGFGIEAGTPYYAMDFVEGQTLAQIIDRMRAAAPEAPTAFGASREELGFYSALAKAIADVTDGLQHAHSRGVVHRDIKPSNLILDSSAANHPGNGIDVEAVEPAGAAAADLCSSRLRILDFGLARLEGGESLSATGEYVGTPLYMSPEQARRKKIPVDQRTDIYSLGATLYEVLTLEPPFRGKDLEDTLSQILQRDPRPPRQLNPRVPRDIETIVLKCLRKDPMDRYATAEALGQDLRRFVRGDPVEARAQSYLERWAHRIRRHRAAIGVMAALAVVAAGALALTSIIVWREKLLTEDALREARAQQERADRNFGYARGAVDEMLTEVGASELEDAPCMEDVRRALLEKARGFYVKFLQEKGSGPEALRALGEAQLRLGDILDVLGRYPEAGSAYREAVGVFETFSGGGRLDPESARLLARAHLSLGKVLGKDGRFEEAKPVLDRASALLEPLVADLPGDPAALDGLAATLHETGKILEGRGSHGEAEQAYRRAVDLWGRLLEAQPGSAEAAKAQSGCLGRLSSLLSSTGDLEGAEDSLRRALAVLESLDEEARERPEIRVEMAGIRSQLAGSLQAVKKPREAEEEMRQVIDLRRWLAANFPLVPEHRLELAKACVTLASIVIDPSDAAEAYAEALKLLRQLASAFPDRPQHKDALAVAVGSQGTWFFSRGQKDEAKAAFREAVTLFEELARDFPDRPGWRNSAAMFRSNLAMMFYSDGHSAEALGEFEGALEQMRELVKAFPRIHEYQANLARLNNNAGTALFALERFEEAEKAFRQAVEVQQGLVDTFPTIGGYRDVLARNLLNLGMALVKLGGPEEAEKSFTRGLELLRGLVAEAPERAERRRVLAFFLDEVAGSWSSAERFSAAAEARREAVTQWRWLADQAPEDGGCKSHLVEAQLRLATEEWRLGRKDEALASYRGAVDSIARHGLQGPDLERARAEAQALLEGGPEGQGEGNPSGQAKPEEGGQQDGKQQ